MADNGGLPENPEPVLKPGHGAEQRRHCKSRWSVGDGCHNRWGPLIRKEGVMVDAYTFMVARVIPDQEDYENHEAYVKYHDYAALESKLTAAEDAISRLRWYQEVLALYESEFWTEKIEDRSEAGAEELKAMYWKAWEDMGRI